MLNCFHQNLLLLVFNTMHYKNMFPEVVFEPSSIIAVGTWMRFFASVYKSVKLKSLVLVATLK